MLALRSIYRSTGAWDRFGEPGRVIGRELRPHLHH